MIAVARRALLPALMLALLACPASAMAAHDNDSFTNARPIGLDENELINNTGAGPVASGDPSPEPLAVNGPGFCADGVYSAEHRLHDDGHDLVGGDGQRLPDHDRHPRLRDRHRRRGLRRHAVAVELRDVRRRHPATSPTSTPRSSSTARRGRRTTSRSGQPPTGTTPVEGIIDFIAWSSPPGDFRDEALPLRPGQAAPGDIRGATRESGENVSCNGLPFSRTVWFSYTAPGPGTATFAAGGTFDTVIAVYRGNTLVGCDDDPSQVARRVTAGTYHVQVGVVGSAPDAPYGNGTLQRDGRLHGRSAATRRGSRRRRGHRQRRQVSRRQRGRT